MKILLSFLFTLVISVNLFASVQGDSTFVPSGKVWGTAFGDYFYKTGGDSTGNQLQYTSYNKDFNTFEFRRIFLGYDYNISEKFFTSVVLGYDGSDVLPNSKRAFFIKDAYLRWKEIFTNSNLTAGLFTTPGYSVASEVVWGYRSVEKTIMDQRGYLFSRDLGVMLNGYFDKEKNYGYYLMIGDGSGASLETNKYKRFYGNIVGNFADKKIIVNAYTDYEAISSVQTNNTFQGFIGYKVPKFAAGIEYFFQYQHLAATNDKMPSGISMFTSGTLYKEMIKFFLRYDYFNQDTKNSSTGFNQSFFTAGLDFMPHPKIHLMPNIWLNAYTKKESQVKGQYTNVVPRITFFYDYK